MSAWLEFMREIRDAGRPIHCPDDMRNGWAAGRAEELGLVHRVNDRRPFLWDLTPAGRAYLIGKAEVVNMRTGSLGRPRSVVRATWLAPLPSQFGGLA